MKRVTAWGKSVKSLLFSLPMTMDTDHRKMGVLSKGAEHVLNTLHVFSHLILLNLAKSIFLFSGSAGTSNSESNHVFHQ